MASDLGRQFALALAEKDADRLTRLLAPDVDFRGMTPEGFWKATGAAGVVDDVLFAHWFEQHDVIRSLVSLTTDTLIDRERVGYRLLVDRRGQTYLVEHQAYYAEKDGRISWMRLMCAGFRPLMRV